MGRLFLLGGETERINHGFAREGFSNSLLVLAPACRQPESQNDSRTNRLLTGSELVGAQRDRLQYPLALYCTGLGDWQGPHRPFDYENTH